MKTRWFTPKRLILAAAVLAAAAGGWAWKAGDDSRRAAELPDELVETARRRDIETKLILTGEVSPAFSVDVKSEISGRVEKIDVDTGQSVHKGNSLVTIDDKDLLTEKKSALTNIEGAKLDVEKKRGNYTRAKALFDEKLISKEVYENLHSDFLIAGNSLTKSEASLQAVEDKLSKTRILAPADGTVLAINVS
ncbi:MAG TPA: efflux RND transporter periplasmic adaptor subunit, partial [Chthoniobacterales bacterium]